MIFYLGTHKPLWLGSFEFIDKPLFVSRRTLTNESLIYPKARGPWSLDSGGFSELDLYGKWKTSEEEYIHDVELFQCLIGNLQWAAPMDWMCEPFIVANTGLTVLEHQKRTILNFARLRETGLPFIPVLQGYTWKEYLRCYQMYAAIGINLSLEPLVAIGSVCRREGTLEIKNLFERLFSLGLKMHAFGVKTRGIKLYQQYLVSSDSMAWSSRARRLQRPFFPWCIGEHINCANCLDYALWWRETKITPFLN